MKKWLKIIGIISLFFVGIYFSLNLALNSEKVQRWGLNKLHTLLGIELTFDKLKFNGATREFTGTNLTLTIPKSNTTIHLEKFNLAFSPLRLIFKKIHLKNLEAQKLSIQVGELPIKKEKQKTQSQNLVNLYNLFKINKAKITQIDAHIIDQYHLSVEQFQLRPQRKFLFYSSGIQATLHELTYYSEKLDVFAKDFMAKGSFGIKYNQKKEGLIPDLNGQLIAKEFLFGFFKKPVPWNDAPGWDESLNELISKKYLQGIPDNRTFAYLKELNLPFTLKSNQLKISSGFLKAFEGILSLQLNWNQAQGPLNINLKTTKPLKMSLLPLGKSQLRQAFEKIDLELKVNGVLQKINRGNLKSALKIALQENNVNPLLNKLTIQAKPTFKNGVIDLDDLMVKLGEGEVKGLGKIDLPHKKIQTQFKGENLDTQTIIRLFSTLDFPGTANTSGVIDGSLTNPYFNFTLDSPNIAFEGLNFGAFDGMLKIKDKKLNLTGQAKLGSGLSTLSLKIDEIFKTSQQKVVFDAQFNSLPAGEILTSEVITGTVKGNLKITKLREQLQGEIPIEVSSVLWYKVPIKNITAKLEVGRKKLEIQNIKIQWNDTLPITTSPKPVAFQFSPAGYTFEGPIIPSAILKGQFNKANPKLIQISLDLRNTSLMFLAFLFPVDVQTLSASGIVDFDYLVENPSHSLMKVHLSQFELRGDERQINLLGKSLLEFQDLSLKFNQARIRFGQGDLTLNGPLSFKEKNSQLTIKGGLDLSQLAELQPWLIEGSGLAQSDLTWQGSFFEPSYEGNIRLNNASLLLRNLRGEFSEAKGTINFSGERTTFNHFEGLYDDAPLKLEGWIEGKFSEKIVGASLNIQAQEVPLTYGSSLRILADAHVKLTGSGGTLKLSGNILIVEGLYYKDYSLTQFVLKPVGVSHLETQSAIPKPFQELQLDLVVKSIGDIEVKNNLADLILTTNLQLRGTMVNPITSGIVNIVEGKIHAFGIDFEDASGFVTFSQTQGGAPMVEFKAIHEIQDYEITAKIKGPTNNLAMILESTPTLPQKDIVSLIAYGTTPDQLSSLERTFFSTAAIASQVVGLLQGPLEKATKLDIVRLESEFEANQTTYSRFAIGKQFSERLAFAFTTDISFDENYKGFILEYRLLDNLLLKGTKDTGSRYQFDLTWRFQGF